MATMKYENGRQDGYEIQETQNDFLSGIDRKRRLLLGTAWFCKMILIGGSFLLFAPRVQGLSLAAQAIEVTYPVKSFQDGKARFYQYKIPDGITIKYFILKSSDEVIRAAFDACDVCWHAGKGYFQQGDFMVCRNCGRKFASARVNDVQGGCNPAPLARQALDGQVVIKISDILEGSTYFDFSRRK